MTNYFVFNGQSSLELGIRIKSKNIFSASKYDMSLVSVPGRNGDLINSNKRFNNAIVSYTCFIPAKSIAELSTKIRNIKKWLYVDVDSYHELTDTYEPDFVRYAVFNSKLDISDTANRIGIFTIQFSCHPFKYLISSMEEVDIESPMPVYNPYPFASKPKIRFFGNANELRSISLTITNSKGTKTWAFDLTQLHVYEMVVDSELMSCYFQGLLLNNIMSGDGFPTLEPGENTISFYSSGSPLERPLVFITKRWNTL